MHRFKPATLASCTLSLPRNLLGYLLAISWMVPLLSAAEDGDTSASQQRITWPFNKGPPGLWDFIIAVIIVITIIICIWSEKKWPERFQDPALGFLLLGCTFGSFCIMGDGTVSLTILLSIGALQVYLGRCVANVRHPMPGRLSYAMSFHLWPFVFILTILLAVLCMKISPTMYNQKVELPWFPFTIPCFGVAVAICVYLGYTWKLLDVSLLPQYQDGRRRRSSL